jgi:hypothetical protein
MLQVALGRFWASPELEVVCFYCKWYLVLAILLLLVLGFTRTRGGLFLLQMVFGVSHPFLILFLKYSMRLLFKVLMEEDAAR